MVCCLFGLFVCLLICLLICLPQMEHNLNVKLVYYTLDKLGFDGM